MDIFTIICIINIISYDFSRFETLDSIINSNWNQKIIKKLSIEYETNTTVSTLEPLIKISFPGIEEGCYCGNVNNVNDVQIFPQKCSDILFPYSN